MDLEVIINFYSLKKSNTDQHLSYWSICFMIYLS